MSDRRFSYLTSDYWLLFISAYDMDIISQTQDGAFWHFKVGGLATDGIYRVADLSRETTNPATWLAANGAEAQNAIDAGGVTLEESNRVVASTAAQSGTKAWLTANPNAMLLIDLPEAELTTQITNLVNALFPTATVANKNKEILWRMTVSMVLRVLIKREGLG